MKSPTIFVAAIFSTILFWATSNVCKYNFVVEKSTNILNVITVLLQKRLIQLYQKLKYIITKN